MGTLGQDNSCSEQLKVSLGPSEHLWQLAEKEVSALGQRFLVLSKRLIQLFQQQAKNRNNQGHSDATAATSQGSVGPSQSLTGVYQFPKAGRRNQSSEQHHNQEPPGMFTGVQIDQQPEIQGKISTKVKMPDPVMGKIS